MKHIKTINEWIGSDMMTSIRKLFNSDEDIAVAILNSISPMTKVKNEKGRYTFDFKVGDISSKVQVYESFGKAHYYGLILNADDLQASDSVIKKIRKKVSKIWDEAEGPTSRKNQIRKNLK
jgi:hypothetical protein